MLLIINAIPHLLKNVVLETDADNTTRVELINIKK